MHASTVLASVALFAGAALADGHMAAYGTPVAGAAPVASPDAASAGKTVHVVQVGSQGGDLTFSPANTMANVGDIVQFQFWPKNHSVVQAAFASPCVPLTTTQPNVTNAFFSGFMPTQRQTPQDPAPVFSVEVTSMNPMWFYCSFMRHCQNGMVGAINSPENAERSVALFTDRARGAAENLSPGQAVGSGNSTAPATPIVPPAGGAPAGTGAPATTPSQFTGASPARLLDVAKNSAFGVAAMAAAFFVL